MFSIGVFLTDSTNFPEGNDSDTDGETDRLLGQRLGKASTEPSTSGEPMTEEMKKKKKEGAFFKSFKMLRSSMSSSHIVSRNNRTLGFENFMISQNLVIFNFDNFFNVLRFVGIGEIILVSDKKSWKLPLLFISHWHKLNSL